MEQAFNAFIIRVQGREKLPALVRISQELIDGFMQGIFDAGAFELGHHQRDAVYEQHRIGNNVTSPAGQRHLELVDDKKVVIPRSFEIDIPNRLGPAVVPVRKTICYGSFNEQFRCGLVDLDQAMAGRPLQVPDSLCNAGVIEPGPAVAQVDLSQRRR